MILKRVDDSWIFEDDSIANGLVLNLNWLIKLNIIKIPNDVIMNLKFENSTIKTNFKFKINGDVNNIPADSKVILEKKMVFRRK